ncbi:MAG TPA: MBL fold metallo-hydrolase [Smithellaceae bacterium]|jgi:glyoxylase-like metal-dependent hydrolase (beta-lactamase superfamily II)|nr:MBL fold metallo-hydrolase [Syntrophaceae bacterium]HPV48783.1 MBL fold metallo-hydrolase [Smithellaceae bacterium]
MISEISENLYRITLPMPFRLRHVHAYALTGGADVCLFDTGMDLPGAYERLEKDLQSIGRSVQNITQIYLSHVHMDHCGMAGIIQDKSKAHVYLSADAHQAYEYFQQGRRLIEQADVFYSRQGVPPDDVRAIIEEIEDMRTRIPLFTAAGFLRDREVRSFGDRSFEVVFTPGHADGHICFFFHDEGLLLAGDHILPYIPPSLSPNIFDETSPPLAGYLTSLAAIEQLGVSCAHPGHGTSFGGVYERISEIREHHALKKELLFKILNDRPKSVFGITGEILGTAGAARDDWEKFMALNETYVYLQELKREGTVIETASDGVLLYRRCPR